MIVIKRTFRVVVFMCIVTVLLFTSTVSAIAPDQPRIYDVRSYGAVGNGSTNDRTAIQNAINAASNGGTIFFPEGDYFLEGTGSELLLITKAVRILGSGKKSKLKIASTVPSTTDVIRISPTPYSSDPDAQWCIGIDALTIEPVSGTPARHALHLDITNAGQFISKFNLQNCFFAQLGGRAVYLTNPSNMDGFFTSIIQNNIFYGGLSLLRAGDSLNIMYNTITGSNCAVDLALVPGAAQTVIGFNNITCTGGAVRITSGTQIKIIYNQIEQIGTHTGPDNACISIAGTSGNYVSQTEILNNNINAHYADAANCIYLNYSDNTRIDNNTFGTGSGSMINVSSNAFNNVIGAGNVFLNGTNYISDNGNNTSGSVKTISLLNNWNNYDTSVFDAAGYYKDSEGIVHLQGLIKDGIATMGTAICNLPAGYRPNKARKFSVASMENGNPVFADINVYPNGDVYIIHGGNDYLSLSEISYKAYN